MSRFIISTLLVIQFSQVLGQFQNWEYCRTYGNLGADEITCSVMDGSGNIYVAGYFYKELTLDGIVLSSDGDYDAFIAKIDINGIVSWGKNFGGNYNENLVVPDYASEIFIDDSGNIILIGIIHSCSSLDTFKIENTASGDIFYIKLDSDGKIIWANSFGNEANDQLTAAQYNNGNIFFSGNQTLLNEHDLYQPVTYLININSNGKIAWENIINLAHQSSKISLFEDFVLLNLTSKDSETKASKNTRYIYTTDGKPIQSMQFNDTSFKNLEKGKNVLKTINFCKDTLIYDTPLIMDGYWQNTAFLNEYNKVEMVVHGKVSSFINKNDNIVLIGNFISTNICDNSGFGFLDFFIGKSSTNGYIPDDNINKDSELTSKIQIHPNPSNSEFIVSSTSSVSTGNILIVNNYGQRVLEITSITFPFTFKLDKAGIYFVRILISNSTFVEKIIRL